MKLYKTFAVLLVFVSVIQGCNNNSNKNSNRTVFEKISGIKLDNEKVDVVTFVETEYDEEPTYVFKSIDSDNSLKLLGTYDTEESLNINDHYVVVYSNEAEDTYSHSPGGMTLRYIARINLTDDDYIVDEILYVDETMEEKIATKVYDYSRIRGRLLSATESEVIEILGAPDKELRAPMPGKWKLMFYYNKVNDDFDNRKNKHLILVLRRDGTFNVSEIKAQNPGNPFRFGIYNINLP